MPCSYRPPEALASEPASCQFADETQFFDVGGLSFCRYHLPWSPADLKDRYGVALAESHEERARLKDKWAAEKVEGFIGDIIDRIRRSANDPQSGNLRGL